jgi:hypothetical protein
MGTNSVTSGSVRRRLGVALILAGLILGAMPGAGVGADPGTIVLVPNYPTALDSPEDIAFKTILDITPVTISMTDRTVVGFGSTDLSFTFRGKPFDGGGSLNIRGTWNPAGGAIAGVFAYELSLHGVFGFDRETESVHYSGTLTGTVLPTDTKSIGLYGNGQVVAVHDYDRDDKKTFVIRDAAAPTFPYLVEDPQQLFAPSPSLGPTVPLEDSGARFSDLAGQVEINEPQPDGSYDPEDWHSAKLNQVLPVDTHIRTMEKSGAILSFADASTFNLKPESEIVLSSASDKEGGTVMGNIRLLAGNMWVNIKKMAKDGSMEVEMSQAAASIKGTTFIVSDDLISSTLQVIEGTVTLTATDGAQAIVTTGQQVTAAAAEGLGATLPFDVATAAGDGTIDHSAMAPSPSSAGPGSSPAPAPSEAAALPAESATALTPAPVAAVSSADAAAASPAPAGSGSSPRSWSWWWRASHCSDGKHAPHRRVPEIEG